MEMETGARGEKREDWAEDGPLTQRCVYVQDRDSKRWSARAPSAEEAREVCGQR